MWHRARARHAGHTPRTYIRCGHHSTLAETGDIIALMAAEDPPPRGPGSTLGYAIVLVGAGLFVTSCFLPYIARGERWTGLPFLLVGAVAAWSLTWIGVLLRLGTFARASLEVGFWLQAVSIGVAVIGTILVATRRTGAHERSRVGTSP
jgi:hypothetical protein